MTDILHIIHCLASGGALRAMAAVAKQSALTGPYRHRVLSILPPTTVGQDLAEAAGMEIVVPSPEKTVRQHIEAADIVQMHFWNTPELYRFLDANFPPMRLVIWFHVAGDHPPQIIKREVVDFADLALACSPYHLALPVFRDLPAELRAAKTDLVIAPPELGRLQKIAARPHKGFNVGYIGNIDRVKMHPDFLEMSAGIALPDVRFKICGSGAGEAKLREAVKARGLADRFQFLGFVEDIGAVIAVLDVFGYPLCAGNYSAADLVLQEVMYAGVPPVIFAHGGTQALVEHGETGLVVEDAEGYRRAIEMLYADPELRTRLGRNAQRHARQHFGPEIAGRRLNEVYQRVLRQPKRRRDRLNGGKKGQPVATAGARAFVYGLGDMAPAFAISLRGTCPDAAIEAEKVIANAGPLLRGPGSGGVLHYRAAYPDDPYLCLWTGLILQAEGHDVRAYIEFKRAIELGLDHWRAQGYLAGSARRIGAAKAAEEALEVVRAEAPAYLQVFGEDGGGEGAEQAAPGDFG